MSPWAGGTRRAPSTTSAPCFPSARSLRGDGQRVLSAAGRHPSAGGHARAAEQQAVRDPEAVAGRLRPKPLHPLQLPGQQRRPPLNGLDKQYRKLRAFEESDPFVRGIVFPEHPRPPRGGGGAAQRHAGPLHRL